MTLVHATLDNFEQEVGKSELPVVIDFYADWCMPCRMMGPVFESLSSKYENEVKFVKLDIEEQQMIAEEFGVMSIPTLVVLNKGKEIGRMSGYMPSNILQQRIDSIVKKKDD